MGDVTVTTFSVGCCLYICVLMFVCSKQEVLQVGECGWHVYVCVYVYVYVKGGWVCMCM